MYILLSRYTCLSKISLYAQNWFISLYTDYWKLFFSPFSSSQSFPLSPLFLLSHSFFILFLISICIFISLSRTPCLSLSLYLSISVTSLSPLMGAYMIYCRRIRNSVRVTISCRRHKYAVNTQTIRGNILKNHSCTTRIQCLVTFVLSDITNMHPPTLNKFFIRVFSPGMFVNTWHKINPS